MPFGRGSTTQSLGDLVIGATYEDAKVEQAFPIYTSPRSLYCEWVETPEKKMMVFGDDLSFPFGSQYIFRGELSNFRWVCSTAPLCWGDGFFQTSSLEASKWRFHPHVFCDVKNIHRKTLLKRRWHWKGNDHMRTCLGTRQAICSYTSHM